MSPTSKKIGEPNKLPAFLLYTVTNPNKKRRKKMSVDKLLFEVEISEACKRLDIDVEFVVTDSFSVGRVFCRRKGETGRGELFASSSVLDRRRFDWPYWLSNDHLPGGDRLCHSAEELVLAGVELLASRGPINTEEVGPAELYVVDVQFIKRSWGATPKVYIFNRPLTAAEADAWGTAKCLTPFICPCGVWRMHGDNAVYVDESTD